MINLDTTQRITTLCDADKHLIYQDLKEDNQITVWELMLEYFWQARSESVVIIAEAFGSAVKETAEKLKEIWEKIRSQIEATEILDNSFHEGWNKFWRERSNNYRKINRMPLRRRQRCRWRQRESRRKLDGLSPQIIILDELYEWR